MLRRLRSEYALGVTQIQPSLISDEDVARELAVARTAVSDLLAAIRGFSTLAQHSPWVALDDLLADLRAAVTTVAALEQLQARAG